MNNKDRIETESETMRKIAEIADEAGFHVGAEIQSGEYGYLHIGGDWKQGDYCFSHVDRMIITKPKDI